MKYLASVLLVLICSPSFAQTKIKLEPQRYFAKEGIEVGNGIAFRPNTNEFYYSAYSDKRDDDERTLYQIYRIKFLDSGNWSKPGKVNFSTDFTEYHPVFNPQGNQIYYNSRRPKPDQEASQKTGDIWRVTKIDDGWGKPEYLSDINTVFHDTYPTIALDGTLYFNSDRPGGKGSMDIYKAEPLSNRKGFSKPEPLLSLNSNDSENDLYVDPEERFLIFNRYIFSEKEIELYISFNKKNSWTEPKALDAINKKGIWELTPTISPDGSRFFYEVNGEVLFVDLKQLLKSVE